MGPMGLELTLSVSTACCCAYAQEYSDRHWPTGPAAPGEDACSYL